MGWFKPAPLYKRTQTNTAGVTAKDRTVVGSRPDGSSPGGSTVAATDGTFVGMITQYSGPFTGIPSNWKVCDGSNGTPDLRDRFILGTGVEANIGQTGGSVSHVHKAGNLTLQNTTVALDAHTTRADVPAGGANTVLTGPAAHTVTPHKHTFDTTAGKETAANQDAAGNTDAAHVLPPYYVLAFIRRMS